jgi:hypothetical protein
LANCDVAMSKLDLDKFRNLALTAIHHGVHARLQKSIWIGKSIKPVKTTAGATIPTVKWLKKGKIGAEDDLSARLLWPKSDAHTHVRDLATCRYALMPGMQVAQPAVPPEFTKFVQARFAGPNVGFLTVCTGSTALALTGILNHLRVASNRKELKFLAQSGEECRVLPVPGIERCVNAPCIAVCCGFSSS